MALKSLPPGFRFHPTDVELILYYLKRKIMGKKLHYEAIAEVNIYKFSPWDLPDKSCLKSKDLEWFFFCPRERKYASGSRVKRATENGYWKTTGKDRSIQHNDQTIGTAKTLVFHLGHAPKGDRTDWVLYEYRILDDKLAAAGMQDTYVLCKVFKKDGMGPKNGAQYGAPFNEADWADDGDAENYAISFASDGPPLTMPMRTLEETVARGLIGSPGDTFRSPLVEQGPSPSAGGTTNEAIVRGFIGSPGDTFGSPMVEQGPSPSAGGTTNETIVRGLIGSPGDTFGSPLVEQCPSPSAGGTTTEVVADETDDNDIVRLLDSFTDEEMLLPSDNIINQCGLIGNIGNGPLPCSDGHDIYNDLGDLDMWYPRNEGVLDFSVLQNDLDYMNNMPFLENSAYMELDDLLPPLDCSSGVTTAVQLSNNETFGTPNHGNFEQLYPGASFSGVGQCAPCSNESPAPLKGSYGVNDGLDLFQMVDCQIYQGSSNASSGLHFSSGPSHNLGNSSSNMERGRSADVYSDGGRVLTSIYYSSVNSIYPTAGTSQFQKE